MAAISRPRNGPQDKNFPKEQFYFHRYDPGGGAQSPDQWKLQFEAHITSLQDSSSPTWNEYFDMGRADPKVMYGGANRSINVSFVLIGLNKEEHKDNHERLLANLGKMTYPIYQGGSGFNGSHVKFLIGGLVEGYGIITSLTYDWQPDYPWATDDISRHRPLYTDVSLGIKVLANGRGERPHANKRYFI